MDGGKGLMKRDGDKEKKMEKSIQQKNLKITSKTMQKTTLKIALATYSNSSYLTLHKRLKTPNFR